MSSCVLRYMRVAGRLRPDDLAKSPVKVSSRQRWLISPDSLIFPVPDGLYNQG